MSDYDYEAMDAAEMAEDAHRETRERLEKAVALLAWIKVRAPLEVLERIREFEREVRRG